MVSRYQVGVGVVLALAAIVLLHGVKKDQRGSQAIVRGQEIYMARCAICHGNQLQGQVNWQTPYSNGRFPAPPHDGTGHTWHHSDKMLVGIVKKGMKPFVGPDYESDMPAFEHELSDQEIADVLSFIKSNWPEDAKRWQEEITKNSN